MRQFREELGKISGSGRRVYKTRIFDAFYILYSFSIFGFFCLLRFFFFSFNKINILHFIFSSNFG